MTLGADPALQLNRDRFFRTAHLRADLKGRSIRGGGITLGAQALKFILNTVSVAILARLLMPADFGVVAMVSAITGLFGSLGDLGLSSATIQRADITHEQVSMLFWINIVVGILLASVVAALAPVIAWFYHDPRLISITLASSVCFVFGGLTAQHYALLTRQMRFGAMAVVQTLPVGVSLAVGVILALAGWGYWTLVIVGIVNAAAIALVTWAASGWKPGVPHLRTGVGSMVAFGGHLTGFNLLNYLTRNADNILIGRALGPGPLGIYSKAYGLLMLPVQQINAPINGVVLPALSRLQDQPEQYRRYFLRAVEVTAFIGIPIIVFSFVDARLIVLTILGPRWLAAVEIFRLLAPAALIGTVNSAPVWIFTSLGNGHRQFLWAAISSPVILTGFVVGLHWGAAGVAASFSVTFALSFALFMVDACRHSPVQLRGFLAVLLTPLGVSVAAAAAVAAISAFWHLPVALMLIIDASCFALVFIGLSLLFPGGRRMWKAVGMLGAFVKRSEPEVPAESGTNDAEVQ